MKLRHTAPLLDASIHKKRNYFTSYYHKFSRKKLHFKFFSLKSGKYSERNKLLELWKLLVESNYPRPWLLILRFAI